MLRRMADIIKRHYTMESGNYKCKYCGHGLAAGTSTTRLRGHLIGEAKTGTIICPKIPDDIRISLCEINKRQKTVAGYIPSPSNLLPVETEGTTVATTLVLQPNGSGANNYLGNQGQEDEIPDMIRVLQSGANNHYIPIFSPDLNNYFVNQRGELQYMMSTHPNESASVENLLLQNVTNFQAGEPSEVVNGWTTRPVERGSTHQPDPLTTTDLPLANESGTRAITPPNESCGNLEPQAFPPTDLVTQEFRNRYLTVDADQHGVEDAANQTGNNRVSPTADVLTDHNGVQSGEVRVHVEVPSAEVSRIQRTRREGIVQSSNERQRSSDEITVQQAAQITRREGILQSSNERQDLSKEEIWILFTQEMGNYRTQVEELAKAVCNWLKERFVVGLAQLVSYVIV